VSVPRVANPSTRLLHAYVPRLVVEWLSRYPDRRYLTVDGSMALVDISGFTQLTERLARKGKVGAEEMSDILNNTFGALICAARPDGADLVKWCGDAVLLLFRGHDHAKHAARAAYQMRKVLREMARQHATAGQVSLRMSVGIHSGEFHFFMVGDPAIHRELVVCGPAASMTARMESVANAGEIAVSDSTAALLAPAVVGAQIAGGRLLRSEPRTVDITEEPSEVMDVDLEDLLAPPIRAHLLATAGESEHRPITVAFIHFSGVDVLLDQTGPDAVTSALEECVRNVQHAAWDHAVTFLESDIDCDGGRIMLVAGAPRSSGDHEERVLHAVREIVDRAGALVLRAGVSRGPVFSGDFGPDFRRTYSVKGDAINLAARLIAKAGAGQVIATHDAIIRSRTVFDTEPLPPFAVKGKSRPVVASLLGMVGGERAEEAANKGEFVGREHEVGVLSRALDKARRRRGTFVEVIGEPGMGKSRLINEIRPLANDIHVVDAPSGSYHSTTAYYPFRTLLRDLLGITAHTDDASIANRLADRVSDNAPHLQPWLPLLAVVLRIDLPPTRETAELDEKFRRPKLVEVAIEFLRVILPTPILLVFENVHLADDASADLLGRLINEVEQQPWVIVVSRRESATGFVPDSSDEHERLVLAPIDESAAFELLASTAPRTPLGQQAMSVIARKAGGNPLFLRELVLAASRSGSVADLPDSVEGVVTSQIDRLDPHDRTLLRCAAVLGVRFSEADLKDMLAVNGRALDHDVLRRIDDFIESDGDDRLRFRHALIRDVAYAGLPYRLRRQLHQQVGQALEIVGTDREDLADQLAMHFFHAANYEKAWTYSRRAADRAQAHYAHIEAMEFLERALEAARHLSELASSRLASVYEQLGDVRDIAGLSTEAADAYHRGRRFAAGDPVVLARMIFKEASIDQRLGKFAASLRLLSRGRAVLDGVTGADADAARSRLATRYAFGRYLQGKYQDAMRWSAIGASEARRAGDRDALAYAYNTMHLAYLHAGLAEEQPFGELALAIYEQLDDLRMQGHCLNNIAIGAMQDGRWTLSSDLLDRAAELFRRVGDTANEANTVYNRADLMIRQGRFDEVAPLLASALRAARAVDDHELVALVLRERGRMLCGIGQRDEALALFDDARGRLTSLGLRQELIGLDGAVAECLMLSGRLDEASTVVAGALARARALRANMLLAPLLRIQGFGLLAAGRVDEARSVLQAGLRSPDGADGQHEQALMMMAMAQISDEQQEGGAQDLHQRSREILDRLGVVTVPMAGLLTRR
jgi:class 3 adenylate cyclase/tetratricopeptide (TPR) repeat protein